MANLLPAYGSFAELAAACEEFCETVNAREHRETRRAPVELLVEERARLHPISAEAYTAAFGETRRVNRSSLVSVGGVRYSVPYTLIDQTVWVRFDGDDLVVVATGPDGTREVARHRRSTPGRARIRAEHYPPKGGDPLARHARPRRPEEAEFLAIGPGAERWLVEAAAAGTARVRSKMADAVALAKLHGRASVDHALGTAALVSRFAEDDLASILDAETSTEPARSADETHSLQAGTSGWAGFGVAS